MRTLKRTLATIADFFVEDVFYGFLCDFNNACVTCVMVFLFVFMLVWSYTL